MASKSTPFSMRLPADTDRLVTDEARRTRRSKGAIVAALAEEALRCRRFPGIAFRGADWTRRPWLIGTGLDLWQIVDAHADFGSVERMEAETDLDRRQIATALVYRDAHPEEIDAAIAENRRPIDELRRDFPLIDVASTGS